MALSANTVWELRANGNALNGGGFVAGGSGTDYSQQDAPELSITDLVIDASDATKVSSSATPFNSNHVNNLLNINSGTGFTAGPRWVQSVTDGVATLDAAAGTVGSTGGTARLGGARVLELAVMQLPGLKWWLKADGTHTLLANIGITSAGTMAVAKVLEGYFSTRGDAPTGDDRPLVAGGAYYLDANCADWRFYNVRATGSGSMVLRISTNGFMYNCDSINTSASANRSAIIATGYTSKVENCTAKSANGYAFNADGNASEVLWHCTARDSAVGLRSVDGGSVVGFCKAYNCTTGVLIGSTYHHVFNNTIDDCTTGISMTTGSYSPWIANNSISNCTTGVSAQNDASGGCILTANNFYNCGTDVVNLAKTFANLSLDPQYVDPSNGDFRIGINLKGMAIPAPLDIGAVQRVESGGGTRVYAG